MEDKTITAQDGSNPGSTAGEQEKTQKPETVPFATFLEQKNEAKEAKKGLADAQSELAKYKQAEEEKKTKELEEQGKYQEIIKVKDSEIESLKSENSRLGSYRSSVESIVDTKLNELKTTVGDDKFTELSDLFDLHDEDKIKVLDKITKAQKFIGDKPAPKGGANIPQGGSNGDRYAELVKKSKTDPRSMTRQEKDEMWKLATSQKK